MVLYLDPCQGVSVRTLYSVHTLVESFGRTDFTNLVLFELRIDISRALDVK